MKRRGEKERRGMISGEREGKKRRRMKNMKENQ
jgi:hypothetical protein